MIGDEVTHYYLVTHQAKMLPHPTVVAEIPHAAQGTEPRNYPHPFLWHYVGAIACKAFGSTFGVVQVYHTLFWLQLLLAAWGLARLEFEGSRSTTSLYLLAVASLPVLLLLAVGFYQDVPVTAQVVTAFCLLRKRRLGWSLLFMALAFSIKVTAVLFAVPFAFVTWLTFRNTDSRFGMALRLAAIAAALFLSCVPMAVALRSMGFGYYPQTVLEGALWKLGIPKTLCVTKDQPAEKTIVAPPPVVDKPDPRGPEAPIIANNPGDLRIPRNYLVFGGGILWLLAGAAAAGALVRKDVAGPRRHVLERHWPALAGAWFVVCAAAMLWTAPDARYFAPALPFLLLPIARAAVRLPGRAVWWPALVLAATLQTGVVLWKIADLRRVPEGIREAIEYLGTQPPSPNRVFMYPEGDYRLFPCDHDWYLGYHLRDLWRGNNDQRMALLQRYQVGVIVVKKHLVREVTADTHDLGVYPASFVHDIDGDLRFPKRFENEDVVIYDVPQHIIPRTE
jgi:hypothetical protein